MSSAKLSHTQSAPSDTSRSSSVPPKRPSFNVHLTSDRLREGSGLSTPTFSMDNEPRKERKSIFKELGLDDDFSDDGSVTTPTEQRRRRSRHTNSMSLSSEKEFAEITGISRAELRQDRDGDSSSHDGEGDAASSQDHEASPRDRALQSPKPWYSKLATSYRRPKVKTASSAPPPTVSSLQRLAMITLLIAVVLPAFSYNNGYGTTTVNGANAGLVRPRDTSPVQICTRWSQQVALLNGTLYLYGGQAKLRSDQTSNTWNNYFLTLDLTKSWDTGSPPLTGLPIPDGPPPVSNGYLWQDYNNLYLYGGEFADNPYVLPAPISMWRYSIASKTWTEFRDQRTSAGNYSEAANIPVQRAAEGAGLSVPELGLSWYFGGHLDLATTPGWSNQIARVYLKSLLEFTHPGYTNNGVYALASGSGAADGGVYRNITQGGIQGDGFPERADGVLVFVPGWGDSGVLIGMAGGTADTFTDSLRVLDVYDIATSEWYHQETTGEAPSVRVNPCAVIASAPDASSFQIYLFGGQNLQPFKQQTQYNDMYILSIPSFTWIKVENSGRNIPSPRAGHTCTMRDGQILVVGGYVGTTIPCDSPGMYVYDASALQWTNRFAAGDHPPDLSPENSVLAGSWGYKVPAPVQSVIGGDSEGGATATTPAAGPATGGPFATGKPPVFTITRSGQTATITQWGTATGTAPPLQTGGDPPGPQSGNDGANPGLIAAGIIAGLLGLLAGYLGFCAWVYRRQVRAYRDHLAVANRYSGASTASFGHGAAGGIFGRSSRAHRREMSTVTDDDSFAWVGAAVEPKWLSDEPTPGSGTGSGSGSASRPSPGASSKKQSGDGKGDYGFIPGQTGEGMPTAASPHGWRDAQPQGGGGDGGSLSSTEQLLEGQEPSFFSVVMGPRRALRVVNAVDSAND